MADVCFNQSEKKTTNQETFSPEGFAHDFLQGTIRCSPFLCMLRRPTHMSKLIEKDGFYQRKWLEYNSDKGLNHTSMYRAVPVNPTHA